MLGAQLLVAMCASRPALTCGYMFRWKVARDDGGDPGGYETRCDWTSADSTDDSEWSPSGTEPLRRGMNHAGR